MKKYVFVLLLFAVKLSFAETVIEDQQEVYGKWTIKGSPYIVKGEAIVPAGKTLTIKPGVEVRFVTGDVRDYGNPAFALGFLRVKGCLVAKGKKNKMIKFTRVGRYGDWGNVVFISGTAKNILQYCYFEHSSYIRSVNDGDNATAAVSFLSSDGLIENCVFAFNGNSGINCKNGSKPFIRNSVFYKNKYGIECNSASSPQFVNCIIWANHDDFFINGKSKPRFSYCFIQSKKLPEDASDKGNNFFNVDPKLSNPASGDFSLTVGSPALKAGEKQANIGLQ